MLMRIDHVIILFIIFFITLLNDIITFIIQLFYFINYFISSFIVLLNYVNYNVMYHLVKLFIILFYIEIIERNDKKGKKKTEMLNFFLWV